MFGFFDYDKLGRQAADLANQYQQAEPFPHAVVDDFANAEKLQTVLDSFPGPSDLQWWNYDNPLEKKLAFDKVHLLPQPIKEILCEMNSAPFLKYLQSLTGIQNLIPDPHYAGGGLHQIPPGGKLGLHADFNFNTLLQLHRRINVILYLNQDWPDSYGGHLELWDEKAEQCYERVLPVFNRMVCFNTTDFSLHGHPDPLTCPQGRYRRSLALYYYSATRPAHEISPAHSTIYVARPQDDKSPEMESLRLKRRQGRIKDETT